MRNAFSLIELIFVITIVGILAMVALPRLGDNDLAYARDQIIRHIRYTQHLALIDDKYLSQASLSTSTTQNEKFKDSTAWYKKMWQIQFHTNAGNPHSYTVYSDRPADSVNDLHFDGTPRSTDLIARDPQTGLFLAGAVVPGLTNDQRLTDVDVESKFKVTVNMLPCMMVQGSTSANHVLFDHLGRPYCLPTTFLNEYNPYNLLATAQIKIILTDRNSDTLNVCIEPESGYVHECL